MVSHEPPPGRITIEHSAKDPIVFYGPPTALRASVRLRNRSNEKAKLTDLVLEAPGLRGPAHQSLLQVSLRTRLYPHHEAQVSAGLAVDAATKPGHYAGVIRHEEREHPTQIYVVDHVDLRLRPRAVFIYTESERLFQRQFVAENAGNVPVVLDAECVVPLRDVAEVRAVLQRGLKDQAGDDTVKAFLRAWADRQVGPLSIRREPVTLPPGEICPLDVTFELPENIQPSRRYVAELQVYTAPVHVEVITSRGARRAVS
jgi:hypothetical protein